MAKESVRDVKIRLLVLWAVGALRVFVDRFEQLAAAILK